MNKLNSKRDNLLSFLPVQLAAMQSDLNSEQSNVNESLNDKIDSPP